LYSTRQQGPAERLVAADGSHVNACQELPFGRAAQIEDKEEPAADREREAERQQQTIQALPQ
jgi:hypothetical protein